MALAETFRGQDSGFFSWLPRRRAVVVPQTPEPAPPAPVFSAAFEEQSRKQQEIDARFAEVVGAPKTEFTSGQDHVVHLVQAEAAPTEIPMVVKTLKDTSRQHLIFALGVPASQISFESDDTQRQQMVDSRQRVSVDTEQVAQNVRLVHILAKTHLDPDGKTILPTAIVADGDRVHTVQRYFPPEQFPCNDPREVQIRERAKAGLFDRLYKRWVDMLTTEDFHHMPPPVKDYWRHNPPDSGVGTNALFLGLDRMVVIDY